MRLALGLVLLAACLSFVLPLSTGRWDPALLHMAEELILDATTGSSVEVGAVEAPFVVEQTDGQGSGWRLRGERIETGAAGDPFRHDVVRPRLEVYRPDSEGRPHTAATLTAGHARVILPRDGTSRMRVHLREGVALVSSGQHLTSESLEVWFDPRDLGGARLRTSEEVTLRSNSARGRLVVVAAGLEGRLRPLRLDLASPVQFSSDTFAAGPLAGSSLKGRAQAGAHLLGRAAEGPLTPDEAGPLGLRLPADFVFRSYEVTFKIEGASTGEGRAKTFELTFARTQVGALAALGGLAGAAPAWRYALASAKATGAVDVAYRRPAMQELRPLDLHVSGESVDFASGDLHLRGAPARLSETEQGLVLAAPRLHANLVDPQHVLLEGSGGVALSVREPPAGAKARRPAGTWSGTLQRAKVVLDRSAPASRSSAAPVGTSQRALALLQGVRQAELSGPIQLQRSPGPDRLRLGHLTWERRSGQLRIREGLRGLIAGVESGRRAAPWSLHARSASLDLRPHTAPVGSGANAWLARIQHGVLEGDVALERRAKPAKLADPVLQAHALARQARRARALRGARFELRDQVLLISGKAHVHLGSLLLRGPALRYRPSTGRLWGSSIEVQLTRGADVYVARAQRGEATLTTDPAAWDADRARRKAARRSGRSLYLPTTIRSLLLEGELRLSGPAALVGAADRLRVKGARAWLTGSPLRVQDELGRRLVAREVTLQRDATRARTQVSARGEVQIGARLAGTKPRPSKSGQPTKPARPPTDLALTCGWLEAELHDPPRRPKRVTRSAWRQSQARALLPLGPFRAGGSRGVSLRLTPPPDAKKAQRVALVAGALSGRGAQRATDGTPVVDLSLSESWAAHLRLPKRGPARIEGRRAKLRLDMSAARAGPEPNEPEETYLRRLLRSLDARDGVSLSAQGLSARAESVELDARRGVYVFRGDPAVIRRGGVSQKAKRWILRLSEE
jgi:hypothetical protein